MTDWGSIYADHYDVACRVLRRRLPLALRGRFDPCDFLNDAMVSILEDLAANPDSHGNEQSPHNLMILIARRRLIDEARRSLGGSRRCRPKPREETNRIDPSVDFDFGEIISEREIRLRDRSPSPVQQAEAGELLGVLEKKTSSDPQLRQLVAMKRDGWSTREAAEFMGIGVRMTQRMLEKLRNEVMR